MTRMMALQRLDERGLPLFPLSPCARPVQAWLVRLCLPAKRRVPATERPGRVLQERLEVVFDQFGL